MVLPPSNPTHNNRCGERLKSLGMLVCVMPGGHAGAHVAAKGIMWRRYDAPDGQTFEQDTLDVISTQDGEVLANANFYRTCAADLLLQAEINSWTWDESRMRLATERARVWASLAISAAVPVRREVE